MPGPGNRSKAARAKKANRAQPSGSVVPRDAYVDDVDQADGWTPVVNVLCQFFELPDMTTRNGLKKIHANFDGIYKKLDSAYQRYSDHDKIRGGIVGIYAKMCVDSLLRNRLFEKGLLDKLIPLLSVDSTRFLALRALTLITQHGGATIRSSLALHAPSLAKLADTYPDDPLLCDLVVSILAHSIGAAVEGTENNPTYPKVLKQLQPDMARILDTTVRCVTQPLSNRSCITHGAEIVATSTLFFSYSYQKAPEATKILVAGLRSKEWDTRALCLGGLMRLHKPVSEDDTRQLDPNRLIQVVQSQSTPDHLIDLMMDYGHTKCDMYATLNATSTFTQAIMAYPQDRDLHKLGSKLARLILSTEFSIADGYYEALNERTGRRERLSKQELGLPFDRYGDALPVCARALRERGGPGDKDAADVLDIKFKIMRSKVGEAADQARRAIERNPSFAYYHYAVSLVANHTDGLRASKKGMMCRDITPFIRFQLMQRAVEHAAELGLEALQKATHEEGEEGGEASKWQVGVAFLQSALEDAKKFLEEAPPDNRYMKNVAYWFILLTIVVSEKVSLDLREVERGISTLSTADDFGTLLGMGSPRTVLRLTQETVRRLYKESVEKYAGVFDRAAGGKSLPEVEVEKGRDDLAAWLEDLHLDCEADSEGVHVHTHTKNEVKEEKMKHHPKVSANMVELYRCSHCGNPSAVLRKCSGCEKARYCDASCQKAHWSDHKKPCKAAQAKPT